MKKDLFLLTTIPNSLNFFKGQIALLNDLYNVTLISAYSPILEEISKREKVNYKSIFIKREISIINDLISLFQLFYLFLKKKPYIIHCNTPKASLLGLIAGYLAKVPNRIYYIHGLRYEGTKGLKRKLLVFLEKVSCKLATEIIAVSYGIKKTANQDLTKKEIRIINNGSVNGISIENYIYDDKNNILRNELKIDENDFVFGFVGRLVGDKGINELIEAFKKINLKFSNTKLILVGRLENHLDPLKPETLNEINLNKNIISVGYQNKVNKYYNLMDVFVSASYREGFGVSLLEANAMGVPVIATNITGHNEIIKEGINGFLIEKKNIEELKYKMIWAYQNKNIIKNMKDMCVSEVVRNYNQKDVQNKALEFYASFINNEMKN